MYINEFWMGVIATIVAELACMFIYGITHRYDDEEVKEIHLEEADEEDVKELIQVLKKMEEKSNVKNNINQGE